MNETADGLGIDRETIRDGTWREEPWREHVRDGGRSIGGLLRGESHVTATM